jgi:plastocyanin
MTARSRTSTLRRSLLAIGTGIACTAALAVPPAAAAEEDVQARLRGSVGPGFDISISDDSVPAGRYRLVVTDKGTIHNFHITGPGVDKKTGVAATGKVVWKLRLRPGTYNIVCDPHDGTMNLTLTVT